MKQKPDWAEALTLVLDLFSGRHNEKGSSVTVVQMIKGNAHKHNATKHVPQTSKQGGKGQHLTTFIEDGQSKYTRISPWSFPSKCALNLLLKT